MAHISLFPEDLLSNILSRLPVKYVMRSRSVCKNWNFMLRSPNFFSLYYKHQSCEQERLAKDGVSSFIVLEYIENASEYDSYDDPAHVLLSFLTVKKMDNELITTVDKVEKIDILTSASLELLSTQDRIHADHINFAKVYDGIICLGNYVGVVLYNPCTRESQRLPFLRSPRSTPRSTPYIHDDYYYLHLGMWFESNQQPGTINHYKVFRVVNFNRHEDPNVRNTSVIEKYDSAEGCWSEIITIRKRQYQSSSYMRLLFNGIIHLYVDGDSVVTLDARLEKLGLLPLPSGFIFKHLCLKGLFVLGRSLALFLENPDNSFCNNIWMMTEYGVKESWTKQYSFNFLDPSGLLYNGWRLLAQWKCMDEDELFIDRTVSLDECKVVSFNLLSGKLTDIYTCHSPRILTIVPYMESFFSFK
ncbi:F-box/kelch-repeat protein At3g06240-like [Impatiens glandulifera]|uniref:F-box/kelch-repeat protein At3g06240-like n=1 Tax=Impatiens glandulifera TaxID=253017 RepID=UPI001FB0996A|nr:F-box/kelch-repeat protein At3g06240-like [Impatiens glandulifera]